VITINKANVEEIIFKALGVSYCAEDKIYQALPEEFFDGSLARSIFGHERLYYIEDGFDCDNWADKLRMEYKERYFNKYVKKHGSAYGIPHYPDIFVECLKVKYPYSEIPHWFVCAIADVGGEPHMIFRERTETSIVIPPSGWELVRLK